MGNGGNILGAVMGAIGYNLILMIFVIVSIILCKRGKKWLPLYIIGLAIQGFSYYGNYSEQRIYSSLTSYSSLYAKSGVSAEMTASIVVSLLLAFAAPVICCIISEKRNVKAADEEESTDNKEN